MSDWRAERDQALLLLEQKGTEPSARADAAETLVHLAADHTDRWEELRFAIPQLLEDAQKEVRRAVVTLAALVLPEPEADEFLASRLRDPADEVRMEAAGQLADRGHPSTRPALAVALEDASFMVRFEAARGMAALRHSAGLQVLSEGLDHDTLRFRAISALAEMGDPAAIPALRKVFKKWLIQSFDRTQAAGALARLGDAEGAEHLLQRTHARGAADRPMAVELCGEVKVPGALARLQEIAADRADPARGAAARGLGRLGDGAALPALAAILEEADAAEDLKLDAAEGLLRLGGADARARVEAALARAATEEEKDELALLLEEFDG
ncbi:MAG TPA: HEAT repeat domain-containing protein [Myxococcales bacterium]|jgi:HEAT repeat protein|nr:HEAT repeat domain-containing protein [Myxococcales bacterium]